MNKFIGVFFLMTLCTACTTQEDLFQSKNEMNYICSSLAKNYLKMSQLRSYELKSKVEIDTNTIHFSYGKSPIGNKIAFNSNIQLFECKKEKYKYVLNEIDQSSQNIRSLLTLNLHI